MATPHQLRIPLMALAVLLASAASGRTPKPVKPPPLPSVVVVQTPASEPFQIRDPLSPRLRAQLLAEQRPATQMPRLENMLLLRGVTLNLDRTLRLRLDLATLVQAHVQQPDTFSMTLEANPSSGWLWLTYHVPGTRPPRVPPVLLRNPDTAAPLQAPGRE